ncbi:hypothetical protein CHUAL_008464 [Chamberlinius hualienensis]
MWRISRFITPLILSSSKPEIAVVSTFRLHCNKADFELCLVLERDFDALFIVLTMYWRHENKRLVMAVNSNALLVATYIYEVHRSGMGRLSAMEVSVYDRELTIAYSLVIEALQPFVNRIYNYACRVMIEDFYHSRLYIPPYAILVVPPRFTRDITGMGEIRSALLRIRLIQHFNLYQSDIVERNADIIRRRTVRPDDLLAALNSSYSLYSGIIEGTMAVLALFYANIDIQYSLLGISVFIRRIDLIEELIRNGAEVNPSAANVVHPFLIAVHMGYDDVCRLLLLRGSNVNFLWENHNDKSRKAIFIHPRIFRSNSCIFYILSAEHNWPFWDLYYSKPDRNSMWRRATCNILVGRCSYTNFDPARALENRFNALSLCCTVTIDNILIRVYNNSYVTVHSLDVLTLQHFCRVAILQSILKSGDGRLALDNVDLLPLRPILKRYLKYQ